MMFCNIFNISWVLSRYFGASANSPYLLSKQVVYHKQWMHSLQIRVFYAAQKLLSRIINSGQVFGEVLKWLRWEYNHPNYPQQFGYHSHFGSRFPTCQGLYFLSWYCISTSHCYQYFRYHSESTFPPQIVFRYTFTILPFCFPFLW